MAVTNGWGKGVDNNTINWGRGKDNATNNWGKIYETSASGDTALAVSTPSFSNTYSVEMDGTDDYIKTDAIYSALDGGTKASFSVWVKPDSGAPKLEYLLHNPRSGTANQGQFGLVLFEDNSVQLYVQAFNSQRVLGDISYITYGSWNHILVTIDLALSAGNEAKMYINGVDRTTTSAMGTLANFYNATDKFYIGEEANGGYNPYNGKMDEVAIWAGTTLTSSDATTIYNSGVPTDLSQFSTPPSNWWRFEEGSGTTISDSSGSADATIINQTTFTTDVPT
tara:strand:- start:31 stop:873 length:843 start_codon:yes stop_codon:yes gene_type:complete